MEQAPLVQDLVVAVASFVSMEPKIDNGVPYRKVAQGDVGQPGGQMGSTASTCSGA